MTDINEVHIIGTVVATPILREMPSGATVLSFSVLTNGVGVPVEITNPEQYHRTFDTDMRVCIHGSVHRRFFRASGATQSRTFVDVKSAHLEGTT